MVVDKLSIRPYFWGVSGVALGDPIGSHDKSTVGSDQPRKQPIAVPQSLFFFPDMSFFQRGEDILYMF